MTLTLPLGAARARGARPLPEATNNNINNNNNNNNSNNRNNNTSNNNNNHDDVLLLLIIIIIIIIMICFNITIIVDRIITRRAHPSQKLTKTGGASTRSTRPKRPG